MPPKKRHKLLLRNLSDQLSTGKDGTGIMDVGRSSRSTRRNNQLAAVGAVAAGEDANLAMTEGGTLDSVDEVSEEFGANQSVLDQERDEDNDNDDDDHHDDDDEEEEEEKDGQADKTPCARGGRPRKNRTDNSDDNDEDYNHNDDDDGGDEEFEYDDNVEENDDDDYEPRTPKKKKSKTTTTTKSTTKPKSKSKQTKKKTKTKSKSKGDYVIDETRVKKQEKWETPDKLAQSTKQVTLRVALVESTRPNVAIRYPKADGAHRRHDYAPKDLTCSSDYVDLEKAVQVVIDDTQGYEKCPVNFTHIHYDATYVSLL